MTICQNLTPIESPMLFLDIATVTGWAVGPAHAELPVQSGSMRLGSPGCASPIRFGAMLAWLVLRLSKTRHRLVVFEAPVGPGMGGKTQHATQYLLTGLCAVTEAACNQTGTPVAQIGVQAIRRGVLGRQPPKGKGKELVLAHIRGLGLSPRDDNEADAIAGWLHSAAELRQRAAALPQQTLF